MHFKVCSVNGLLWHYIPHHGIFWQCISEQFDLWLTRTTIICAMLTSSTLGEEEVHDLSIPDLWSCMSIAPRCAIRHYANF